MFWLFQGCCDCAYWGFQKTVCRHHFCSQYQPCLWWLDVTRAMVSYGQLKCHYNHLWYHFGMITHIMVVQSILYRYVCMDSFVGYVFIHGQSPCPWWLFENIVEKLKKWSKLLYLEMMYRWNKLINLWCILVSIFFFKSFLLNPIRNIFHKSVSSFEM